MMKLYFRPHPNDLPAILLATQHRRLWKEYGDEITKAFYKTTGKSFKNGARVWVMYKDPNKKSDPRLYSWSHSGKSKKYGMLLCYQNVATDTEIFCELLHELAHRLLGNHKLIVNPNKLNLNEEQDLYESHRIIFIFLIDVIEMSFNPAIASRIIKSMDARYNHEDAKTGYRDSWNWAKILPKKRRHELTRLLFDKRQVIQPDK